MTNREEKANFLFDEIGLVSDRFVHESIRVTPFPKRINMPALITTLSACAVLMIVVGVFVLNSLLQMSSTVYDVTLMETLSETIIRVENGESNSNITVYFSKEDIDLFDNTTKIIWCADDESKFYVLSINDHADANYLKSKLNNLPSPTNADISDTSYEFSVWVSYGDGTAVSPFLSSSGGNVFHGSIDSYSPEIIPSLSLQKTIIELLDER